MTREEMRLDALNVQYVLTINRLHDRIDTLKSALRTIRDSPDLAGQCYRQQARIALEQEDEDID